MGTDLDANDDIGCASFMPESFCNSTDQCDCQSGRKAIRRNSDCQVRKSSTGTFVRLGCFVRSLVSQTILGLIGNFEGSTRYVSHDSDLNDFLLFY